jgi:hypothetical protein
MYIVRLSKVLGLKIIYLLYFDEFQFKRNLYFIMKYFVKE